MLFLPSSLGFHLKCSIYPILLRHTFLDVTNVSFRSKFYTMTIRLLGLNRIAQHNCIRTEDLLYIRLFNKLEF